MKKDDIGWILIGAAILAMLAAGLYIEVTGFQKYGWIWLLR